MFELRLYIGLFSIAVLFSRNLMALELEGRLKHQYITQQGSSDDTHQSWLNRLLARQNWQLAANQHLLVEGISAYDSTYSGELSTVEKNSADIHQLIFTTTFANINLKFGRQVWSVGEQRLLGKREGTNVRRRFDGIWFEQQISTQQDLAFYHGYAVNNNAHSLDDSTETQRAISGLLFTRPKLQVHLLRFRDTTANNSKQLYFLDVESRFKLADYDVLLQGIYQFGRDKDRATSAWFTRFAISHQFAAFTIGASGSYASGSAPHSGQQHTFKTLFAKAPYYSEAGVFATSNIQHIGLKLDYLSSDASIVHFRLKQLFRVKHNGNIYGPGNDLLLAGDSNAGWRLASTVDLSFEYQFNPKLSLEWVGSYVKPASKAKLSPTIFLESMLHYRF